MGLFCEGNVLLCPYTVPEISEEKELYSSFMNKRTDINEIGRQKKQREKWFEEVICSL